MKNQAQEMLREADFMEEIKTDYHKIPCYRAIHRRAWYPTQGVLYTHT